MPWHKSIEQLADALKASSKTLYVLCGLPYSGKTHVAQELLGRTSCAYVSIDGILERMGYDWNATKLPDEQGWKEVMTLSYEECRKALNESSNVLYDSTNHTKASRDSLRKVASDASAKLQIIYVDVPIEVIRSRWEENKVNKQRFILDEAVLNQTIASLEIPTHEEKPWVLKN